MNSLEHRIDTVLSAIDTAARSTGRAGTDIVLVAVSKNHPVELMNQASVLMQARGRPVVFGENYLQEFSAKQPLIQGSCQVHMIGPLQSNKVARAVELFDLIESVHSEKVLRLIDAEAAKRGKVMPVYLQINVSADPAKSGFATEEVARICHQVLPQCRSIRCEGLMTITGLYEEAEQARPDFVRLRELARGFPVTVSDGKPLALSMGMSSDFAVAIAEGATHVRIGSAIFGDRG